MKRREFLGTLGAAAVTTWPLSAPAQQPAIPIVGFLSSLSANDAPRITSAFQEGLKETGYVAGQDVRIEYRFAEGRYDHLPRMVADLVRLRVAVIAAVSGTPAALAAKAATETIPIVFVNGGDPIASGLVSNLSRPAQNVTGVTFFTAPLTTKRLELLRQLAPEATTVGVLVNPVNPPSALEAKTVPAAARTLGMSVSIFNASNPGQIDETFAAIARQSIRALYVSADPLFFNQRNQVIALAIRHSVVATYADREIAEAGGLVSYGASRSDAYRQGGVYVGRILKGEHLGALPVMLPTKYELILNLKTAKALNLSVPWQLQQLADEVIE